MGDLARKNSSPTLAQLASRMSSAVHSASGDDQFAKVKGLIADMLARLESEASADATENAFCDKELAETIPQENVQRRAVEQIVDVPVPITKEEGINEMKIIPPEKV